MWKIKVHNEMVDATKQIDSTIFNSVIPNFKFWNVILLKR